MVVYKTMDEFKVDIISTGSKGNVAIIDDTIMIDCGLPYKHVKDYLSQVKALLITHRHGDHLNVSAIKQYHKKYPWRTDSLLYVNEDTKQKIVESHNTKFDFTPSQIIDDDCEIDINIDDTTYHIETFKLEHDVENQGFIITKNGTSLIYATDTNTMEHAPDRIYDYLVVEANYDEDKLFDDLISDSFEDNFRARRNHRHLSIQNFKEFVRSHMHSKSEIYALHESNMYGLGDPIYQTGIALEEGDQ